MDLVGQRGQTVLPEIHLSGELFAALHQLLCMPAARAIQYAQHVFAGEHFTLGRILLHRFSGRVHRSRHAFRRTKLRRIQLFTVPSGVLVRWASSS